MFVFKIEEEREEMTELKIMLTGSLDSSSTKKEINAAIKSIQSDVSKVKIGFDLDTAAMKTLKDFSKQMKELIVQSEKLSQSKLVMDMPDGTRIKMTTNSMGELSKVVEDVGKNAGKTGETLEQIGSNTAGLGKARQAVTDLNKEFTNAVDQTERFNKSQENLGATMRKTAEDGRKLTAQLDKDGGIKSYTIKTDFTTPQKEFEHYQKQVVTGLTQIDNKNKVTASSLNRLQGAFNSASTVQEMKRVLDMINRINDQYKNRKDNQNFISVKDDAISTLDKFYKNNEKTIKSNKDLNQTFQQTRQGVLGWSKDMKDAEIVGRRFESTLKSMRAQAAEASRTNIGVIEAFNTA